MSNMQLYDKLSDKGKTIVLEIAAACGITDAKIATDLTPPGERAVCIKFKRLVAGKPGYEAVGKLDAAGFYSDILSNGYTTECSQAFVESKVFAPYR